MRRGSIVTVAVLFALVAGGCAGKPTGPRFSPLIEPGPADSLVYIYRQDSLRGVGSADVRLNGEKLGRMLNGEYLAFLVDPGQYELRARMRWLGIIPRSWNRTTFEVRPGETLFLRIWAQYDAQPAAPAAAGVPGRSDEKADVVLFVGSRPADIALAELAGTRRAPGP